MKKVMLKPKRTRGISAIHKMDPYQRGYLAAKREMNNDDSEESHSGCLCVFLGVILGPIGIVIAAIIGKAGGVKAALIGWFVSWVIAALIWCMAIGALKCIQ